MNETILELILTAVMAFFMLFGLIGCRKEKKEAEEKWVNHFFRGIDVTTL